MNPNQIGRFWKQHLRAKCTSIHHEFLILLPPFDFMVRGFRLEGTNKTQGVVTASWIVFGLMVPNSEYFSPVKVKLGDYTFPEEEFLCAEQILGQRALLDAEGYAGLYDLLKMASTAEAGANIPIHEQIGYAKLLAGETSEGVEVLQRCIDQFSNEVFDPDMDAIDVDTRVRLILALLDQGHNQAIAQLNQWESFSRRAMVLHKIGVPSRKTLNTHHFYTRIDGEVRGFNTLEEHHAAIDESLRARGFPPKYGVEPKDGA